MSTKKFKNRILALLLSCLMVSALPGELAVYAADQTYEAAEEAGYEAGTADEITADALTGDETAQSEVLQEDETDETDTLQEDEAYETGAVQEDEAGAVQEDESDIPQEAAEDNGSVQQEGSDNTQEDVAGEITVQEAADAEQPPVLMSSGEESTIESITAEPVHVYENTAGYQIPGTEDGTSGSYFLYALPIPRITVNYKNGDVITGTPSEIEAASGNAFIYDFKDAQSADHPYTVNNTYLCEYSFMDCSGEFEFVIDESPVQSLTIEPVTIAEHTFGSPEIDDETGEEFFYYYGFDPQKITITYKDGTTYTGNYDAVCALDSNYMFFYGPALEQSSGNEWTLGNTYECLAQYMGVTASYTVTIVPEPAVFNIEFNGNGADFGYMPALSGCTADNTDQIQTNGFTKEYYTFKNWNTKPDGTGTAIANKAQISSIGSKAETGDTITLYAQWVKQKYTITYKLNGGTQNSGNPTYVYFDSAAAALKNPTRKGYTFKGWYTNANFSGSPATQIPAKSPVNRTYYAKWAANSYSVILKGNNATSGTTYKMTGMRYGTSYALPANTYKRTGYTFAGWNTKADGTGKTYANKSKVSNLSASNGATVTLYAKWTKTKYTITYKLNSGTQNKKNPAYYYITSSKITLKNPTRTGYTFKGWYANKNFKGKQVKTIAKGSTGKKTLYAKWQVNKYTIKYNGNGATSGSMSKKTGCKYSSKYRLAKNAYKRTGYTFTGWNTKKDGSGTTYKNRAYVKKLAKKNGASVTLYAQWKVNKYTIKYNGNGATSGSMSNKTGCKYTSKYTLAKNAFARKGYKFTGWNTKKDGSGTAYKNLAVVKKLSKKNGAAVTLYAQWKKISTVSASVATRAASTGSSSTVYITNTGSKYHNAGCRYLRQSSHAVPLSDAKNMGLTPCSVCH